MIVVMVVMVVMMMMMVCRKVHVRSYLLWGHNALELNGSLPSTQV